MTKTVSIQLKAIFLILVFGFNMAVGFACAIGIGTVFNTAHCLHDEAATTHVHADGKKHHHEKPATKDAHRDEKDDCCTNKVLKISQADKAVPQAIKLQSPAFFTGFIPVYNSINISCTSLVNTSPKYFVFGYHPPIPDIRIAIQSFLI